MESTPSPIPPATSEVVAFTPGATPSTPPSPAQEEKSNERPYASFHKRLVAFQIDTLLYQVVFLYVLLIMVVATPWDAASAGATIASLSITANFIYFGLGFLYSFLYLPITTSRMGATFGKYIVGIQVQKTDSGKQISYLRALLRCTIGYFLSEIVFLLGFIWILFDKQKQGWHDKIAGTQVVVVDKKWSNKKIVGIIFLLYLLSFIIIGIVAFRVTPFLILNSLDLLQTN